eukprot:scaffold53623_cov55-Attheya_sp.AAC.3
MGRNPFISFDQSIIEGKMRALLLRLSDSLGSGRLAFTLAIDGTKVAQAKQISQKYNAIIGGSHPNHFITLHGLSDEEVKEKSTQYLRFFSVGCRGQSCCNVMPTCAKRWQISSFLQGESNIFGLVDPNHNAKNS